MKKLIAITTAVAFCAASSASAGENEYNLEKQRAFIEKMPKSEVCHLLMINLARLGSLRATLNAHILLEAHDRYKCPVGDLLIAAGMTFDVDR